MPDFRLLDHPAGPAVAIVIGIVLVLAGRRLFWLAVGVAGFMAGRLVAERLLHMETWWLAAAAGLVGGILGAFLTIFLQRLLVGVTGFVAGGWIAAETWHPTGLGPHAFAWVFLLGGVIAAIVAMALFELALMAVSSLLGAILIVEAAGVRELAALPVIVAIAAVGLVIQAGLRGRRRR